MTRHGRRPHCDRAAALRPAPPRGALWTGLLAGLVLMAGGCVGLGPGLVGTPCPVAWEPLASIDPDRRNLRARMELRVGEEEIHLELISEDRPEELVVVGLARFGVRLFAVRQRGDRVEVESASRPEVESLALWAMDALHRSYWIPASVAGDPNPWPRGEERVHETATETGRRRVFSLVPERGYSADPRGTSDAPSRVSIDYARPTAGSTLEAASIRNPFCGYEARVVPIRSAGKRAR